MAVLSGLQPEKVFYYFEELCGIPHGSYNTKEISDYCVKFAQDRGLRVRQDSVNNVIIKKAGTDGYEKAEPVIIQGHLDMVCERTRDSDHDFEKDGLILFVEDGFVKAENTTLGADDGIAVAMALALLDSDEVSHPPLEVVFTTEEEVGMEGAFALDISDLKGTMLLNIDSEEEGILTAGCAGGYRFDAEFPVEYEDLEGEGITIRIQGLTGGHSGVEIHKQRGNAHVLMGRLLCRLNEKFDIRLVQISGGSKDNVIAVECTAQILVVNEEKKAVRTEIEVLTCEWKEEFGETEPDFEVIISEEFIEHTIKKKNSSSIINYLSLMPDGVISYEREIPGQVETSLNAGMISVRDSSVIVSHLVRSSLESKKRMLKEKLLKLTELAGGKGYVRNEYPAWSYKKESRLRELMTDSYRELFGKMPEVVTIHAGLECGLFAGKKPEMDCVSFGPDILDIHSIQERLNIASVERTWKYLLQVLKKAK